MSEQHSKPETKPRNLSIYGVKGWHIHTETLENAKQFAKQIEELNEQFPIGKPETWGRKISRSE